MTGRSELTDAEVEAPSQVLDESALHSLLNTLHPLSDTELGNLMREQVINHRF
ncbi:hypothetical protein ACFW9L_31500 [Streptomyces sp. NPDC059517]|uniref:hypothetical protein n=1 Tax=Streptomyces sp. NPDC059517 TaxID=3346855 RepID=UPI0036C57EB5